MTIIAVASSDEEFATGAMHALVEGEFTAAHAEDGLQLLRVVFDRQPEVVIIDSEIAEVDAPRLIRLIRAASDAAILAVITSDDLERRVELLDAGADDIADRAAPASELVARVRAVLRRAARARTGTAVRGGIVETGELVIDLDRHTLTRNGERVELTRTEYRLLEALAARIGETAPYRYLLSLVWGDRYTDNLHQLRVYIGYLRKKLEDDRTHPRYILNERRSGYRLALLPSSTPARAGQRSGAERSGTPEG